MQKEKIPLFLISLFPIFLITGPLLPEILLFITCLVFLLELFKCNNFKFFKNFFFLYFFVFFTYLIFTTILSDYKNDILIKSLFNYRYLIFVFAVYFFIKKNNKILKYFFYIFTLIFVFLIIDGFYQYYFEQNIFGFPKIRDDRVSSVFNDKLVLGSFISKFIFLYAALYFFLNEKKPIINNFVFTVIIFLLFLLIFISGDRAALFLTMIGLFLLIILLDIKKKIIFFSFTIIILSSFFIYNKTFYDRYISQTTSQINFQLTNSNENFFERFKYYNLIWSTNYNAFLDKKIVGHGPKSFRFFCNNKKYEVLSKNKSFIRNDLLSFDVHKKTVNSKVLKIFFKKNDAIKKNDTIFSYLINDKEVNYISNKAGKIKNIYINDGDIINPGHLIFDLDLQNLDIPIKYYYYTNGCTTHPHQIYMQLLSETGLIGFLFIFSIFIYILFQLLKHFFYKIFKFKSLYKNYELFLLVNFFIFLFPFTTSGNIFNNWFVMLHLVQISITMHIFDKKKTN
jgi:O-antigen ligase